MCVCVGGGCCLCVGICTSVCLSLLFCLSAVLLRVRDGSRPQSGFFEAREEAIRKTHNARAHALHTLTPTCSHHARHMRHSNNAGHAKCTRAPSVCARRPACPEPRGPSASAAHATMRSRRRIPVATLAWDSSRHESNEPSRVQNV